MRTHFKPCLETMEDRLALSAVVTEFAAAPAQSSSAPAGTSLPSVTDLVIDRFNPASSGKITTPLPVLIVIADGRS